MNVFRKIGPVAAAILALSAVPASAEVPAGQDRAVITRLSDLPTYSYPMPVRPSEMVRDPAAVRALAEAIERDVRADLARFDIQDVTAVRRMHGTLLTIAMLKGDDAEASKQLLIVREMQEKPSARLTSGRISEALIAARRGSPGEFAATLESHLESALGSLPWEVVEDDLQGTKGYLEYVSEGLVVGSLESSLDPPALESRALSQQLADNILGAAYTLTVILPNKPALLAAYAAVVDSHKEARKPDIWAARDVSLDPSSRLSPVGVAVWDSGIDFGIAALGDRAWVNGKEIPGNGVDDDGNGLVDDVNGIGFTLHGDYTPELLFPISSVGADPAVYQQYSKGFSDLQASVDSAEATELKQKLSSLPKDEYQPFVEGLSAYGNYAHGTHVAGLAVAGNPAARLMAARITFDHRVIGDRPTIAQAYRDSYAAVRTVDYFVEHGVKVVNMSWGGDLAGIEAALEQTGAPGTPEERRALARRIYDIGYKALLEAMRDASGVLFVVAAGNSDNNVEFDEVYPSSIKLPNVMVAGAVDQAGDETSFTSFGNSEVFANGFEVDSYVPGGARLKFSGTSMAAPNVTNLAAKLWAVYPDLTVAEVRQLIVDGADEKQAGDRAIRLMNPARTMELAARRAAN
ncbi:MAG: S8 family serine peptidase [Steroidobacteraceae bacterium]|jgi:subtilisin family serine protease|nr:S8 family serine peptidase [Steroidobacteraceae bacterium]